MTKEEIKELLEKLAYNLEERAIKEHRYCEVYENVAEEIKKLFKEEE